MEADRRTRIIAVCVTLFGILWLSPDSILVRLYSCPVPTQLMYKNLFFSLLTIPFVALECGGWNKAWLATKENGYWSIAQALLFTATQYCFTYSVTNTAAATTLVLLASSPLFCSFWSRIFLGEKIKCSTFCAMVGGAIGITIVFVGNLSAAASIETHNTSTFNSTTTTTTSARSVMNHPLGITLGLVCAISIALYFTLQRHVSTIRPNASSLAALCFVGPICVIIGFIGGGGHIEEPIDILWAFLQGGVVGPIAFGALAIAPRYLLASEVGLLQLMETIVGPIWVYIGGYEIPPLETVWGGLILLGTLTIYFAYELGGKNEEVNENEEVDENENKVVVEMDSTATCKSKDIVMKETKAGAIVE